MSPSTTDLWACHHGDRSSGPSQLNDERASCVLGVHAGQQLLFAQYLAGNATGTRFLAMPLADNDRTQDPNPGDPKRSCSPGTPRRG